MKMPCNFVTDDHTGMEDGKEKKCSISWVIVDLDKSTAPRENGTDLTVNDASGSVFSFLFVIPWHVIPWHC